MTRDSDDAVGRLDAEFARILEDSLNEIYIFEAESLKFVQVNRGARENLGYSLPELRKMTPLDLKPDIAPESFAHLLAPLIQNDQAKICFETRHRRKDGSLYNVEIHLQMSTYHDHPVYVAIAQDRTELDRTSRELHVRESAIECAKNGVVITDPSQHDNPIIYCNQAFQDITASSAE